VKPPLRKALQNFLHPSIIWAEGLGGGVHHLQISGAKLCCLRDPQNHKKTFNSLHAAAVIWKES